MAINESTVLLFGLPRLVEVRWLGAMRLSLFTADFGCLDAALCDPTVAGFNAYLVVNPLLAEVLVRRQVTLDRLFRPAKGQCSADVDVACRLLLPFDWDVQRPTGTAATEAQRGLSAAVAESTISYLCSAGFPPPAAVVDSGNGRHGYFRLQAPNDGATDSLLTAFYGVLARRFDTPEVKLDKSVRSAAQLMRLPGTFNFKAGRYCQILSFTEATAPVSPEMLRRVTEQLRGELGFRRPFAVRKGVWTPELVEAFLQFYDIDYLPPAEVPQGILWVLNPCPLNSEHMGTSPAILLCESGFPKFCCKHRTCQMTWKQFRGRLFRLTKRWFITKGGVGNAE